MYENVTSMYKLGYEKLKYEQYICLFICNLYRLIHLICVNKKNPYYSSCWSSFFRFRYLMQDYLRLSINLNKKSAKLTEKQNSLLDLKQKLFCQNKKIN